MLSEIRLRSNIQSRNGSARNSEAPLILFENGAPAKTLVGARPLAALERELGLVAPAEAA